MPVFIELLTKNILKMFFKNFVVVFENSAGVKLAKKFKA